MLDYRYVSKRESKLPSMYKNFNCAFYTRAHMIYSTAAECSVGYISITSHTKVVLCIDIVYVQFPNSYPNTINKSAPFPQFIPKCVALVVKSEQKQPCLYKYIITCKCDHVTYNIRNIYLTVAGYMNTISQN